MIEFLININKELIKKYDGDPEKQERQLIISCILTQKNCIFKLTIEDAYNILKDLQISNYKDVYENLISYNEYLKD